MRSISLILGLIFALPLKADPVNPCEFAQVKAVEWIDTPLNVESYYFRSLGLFIFSKASDEYMENYLNINVKGYIEKNATACKLRNNQSIARTLQVSNGQTIPKDDCISLNKQYLKELGRKIDQIEWNMDKKRSGPAWVFSLINYERQDSKVIVSIPSLVTELSDENPNSQFRGVHYCKLVDPNLLDRL